MKISIKCGKCGNDKFEMPARPSNTTKVTCSKCGAVDTYGGMLKRIEDKVVKHIKRKLGDLPK